MSRSTCSAGRSSGFTLIQMLVVLGIVGILVGALVYANRAAKVRAYNVQALVCAEQIRKAESLYYVANKGFGTYSQLDTGMLSRCSLVQVTPVTETASSYEYSVKHALGSAVYSPSEQSDAVAHTDTPISLAASNGGSGGSAPSGGGSSAPTNDIPVVAASAGGAKITVTLARDAFMVAGNVAASVTVTNSAGQSTVLSPPTTPYPAGRTVTYSQPVSSPSFAPGTYTVTASTTGGCVSLQAATLACSVLPSDVMTQNTSVTLSGTDQNLSVAFKRPLNILLVDWTYNAGVNARNLAMELVSVYNVNDPSDLNCVGDCAYAQPGVWANQGGSSYSLASNAADTPLGGGMFHGLNDDGGGGSLIALPKGVGVSYLRLRNVNGPSFGTDADFAGVGAGLTYSNTLKPFGQTFRTAVTSAVPYDPNNSFSFKLIATGTSLTASTVSCPYSASFKMSYPGWTAPCR